MRQIFENAATMDEALKHQIIENIEDAYITELLNKYKGFMRFNTVNLVHHIMYRYEKIIESDLKENQKRFDETLDTTIPIDKYFEQIDDCIQYANYGNQPYTAAHIINNTYNTVLFKVLFQEPIKK